MRSAFNGQSASVGTGNLDLINYHITAPGALFCTNPPHDKGLRWRSILVKLPEFLPGIAEPRDAEDKVLSADAAGRLGRSFEEAFGYDEDTAVLKAAQAIELSDLV